MRRFFNLIVVLVCSVTLLAQNEEPIIITAPDTVINKTAYTLSDQGITISVDYGSAFPATHSFNNLGQTYFACHANSSITFTAGQPMKGLAINGWVKKNFSASCDNGQIDYLSDEYEDSTGEPVLTVTDIDATSVTISCINQLRCFSVEIYFSENPGEVAGEVMDTVHFIATTAQAADYSEDEQFSYDGHYSYWLNLIPDDTYPQVWLDMYAAVKGDLSGTYSLYDFNVGEQTYVQLSADEMDYEFAYDQEFTITATENGYHIDGYIIADNDVMYSFIYDGPIPLTEQGTGLESASVNTASPIKRLSHGQIIIIRDNKTYNLLGKEL